MPAMVEQCVLHHLVLATLGLRAGSTWHKECMVILAKTRDFHAFLGERGSTVRCEVLSD